MKKDIVIRDYQVEDWPEIKLILLESDIFAEYGSTTVKSEKKRIEFYTEVPEKGKVFTAVLKNKQRVKEEIEEDESQPRETVVGYTILDFFGRGIFILSLIIRKQYQNQGIGKHLLNYIKTYAKKNPQFEILRGFIDEHLIDVHAFLRKQGFKACGFVEHDLSWNHSTIHYVYQLRDKDENEKELFISA